MAPLVSPTPDHAPSITRQFVVEIDHEGLFLPVISREEREKPQEHNQIRTGESPHIKVKHDVSGCVETHPGAVKGAGWRNRYPTISSTLSSET